MQCASALALTSWCASLLTSSAQLACASPETVLLIRWYEGSSCLFWLPHESWLWGESRLWANPGALRPRKVGLKGSQLLGLPGRGNPMEMSKCTPSSARSELTPA